MPKLLSNRSNPNSIFHFSISRIMVGLGILLPALTGCSHLTVDHARGFQSELIPQEFFQGKICADGVVRDRSGAEIRAFNAVINASWDTDGVGTLDEVFYFDEGLNDAGELQEATRETRIWTLTPQADNKSYQATATDVPQAGLMTFAGNGIHMNYVLQYGEPGDTIALDMDDWMYQVADGVVVNETKMSKFGIHVGQVLLVMRQVSQETVCHSAE